MVEGRSNDLWNHTSEMMALHANIHRDHKKQRRFVGADFHPHVERKQRKRVGVDPERWWAAAVRAAGRK